MLEVGTLCKPCKVFLGGFVLAPLVALHGGVDDGTYFRRHIIIYIVEEGVEVAAEHLA